MSELGRGGMGIVYEAHDPRIDRVVAIKTIRKDRYADDVSDTRALERFEREARAAGKLSHPGIVTIYDVAEDGDELYIAMEFVEGISLRTQMQRRGRFALGDAIDVLTQVCDALGYAHTHGVVHRDVKPDNILCLADGTVKLADFGIARIATATATHTAIGTPRYMAPEQWRGAEVDGRTDLYAVGVMLYELLTADTPFTARSTTQLMYVVLNDAPRLPSQIDPGLPAAVDAVVQRALAREPSDRYQSATELAHALEQLAREHAPAAGVEPVRLTILRRGDVHFVDLAETGTLIPRSETRVEASFMAELADEVERVAAGRDEGRGAETLADASPAVTDRPDRRVRLAAHPASADDADRIAELQAVGRLIYSHLLTEPARRKIAASTGGDLYLRLDEQLVQVPWELCYDGRDFLATKFRVGRQVITERPLPSAAATDASAEGRIEILLVTDPTETLAGAREECRAIEAELAAVSDARVNRLTGKSVRKVALLQALARSTIVHFAGHSVYDPEDPSRSGWVLADGVLTAGEMTKLDRLPRLVFSNSCHAGATVGWDGRSSYEGQAFGIGSAFLLAGVPNYVGTFWVTHDAESALFARAFYQAMLRGVAIGEAMQAARRRVVDQCGWNELTWASYMLYGDPAFRLPVRRSSTVRPSRAPTASASPSRAPTLPMPAPPDTSAAAHATTRPTTTARGRVWTAVAASLLSIGALVAAWATLRPGAERADAVAPIVTAPPAAATMAPPTVGPPSPTPLPTPELPARYDGLRKALEFAGTTREKRLEIVDELSKDDSDWATGVLIHTADNDDRYVAMAAIGGLAGRACAQVQMALIDRLDDAEPGKRAYAAKALGDSGCVEALEALSTRFKIEATPLVLDNLRPAIEKLIDKTKG